MTELHYTELRAAGISRRTRGRGFSYAGPDGRAITDVEVLGRISALALPPAWRDVWICSDPLGHIQATGVDAAGRRQYRYHDDWRTCRDRMKFERMLEFAQALPRLRQAAADDLARPELDRRRVLACAVRLLDRGFFRIGSEQYAEANETFGLATICRDHVRLGSDNRISFDYVAKSKKRRVQSVVDPAVYVVVAALKARRGDAGELLAYRRNGRWQDVRSVDINDYLKEHAGNEFSAKDFRTWNGTVLAAVGLAVSTEAAGTPASRGRVATRVVAEVARYLGNTPAVCRSSYIDPRVFERYDEGLTIDDALGLESFPGGHEELERAVLELLERGRGRVHAPGECATRAWDDPAQRERLRRIARCAA